MRRLVSDSLSSGRISLFVLAAIVLSAITATAARALRSGPVIGAQPPVPARLVAADYKTPPVYFEENHGQTDPRVRFLAHGPGYTIFLTPQGSVVTLRKQVPPAGKSAGGRRSKPAFTNASVWMNLAGARTDAQVEGLDPLPGRVNYFIGNDPGKWHTGLPTYARVRYRSVYPGIDLIYLGTPQALEYDLIAAPGADPGAIRLELQGANRIRINDAGDLVVSTAAGDLRMRKPRVYQETKTGARRAIDAHYKVAGTASRQIVELALAGHDPGLPLIIDPEIVYSTYLGGSGSGGIGDAVSDLKLGPGNSVYVTGTAASPDFPTTLGALMGSGADNAFIAKFATTRTGAASLLFSTYLAGTSSVSQSNGIAVDGSGDAYIVGGTPSLDFPNKCAAFGTGNNQAAGTSNGFVAELNPGGNTLIYSCFIHGTQGAVAMGVAVKPGCKSNCEAFVVGNSASKSGLFPIVNGYQTTNPDTLGVDSGYVLALAGDHGSVVYSTFLGGSGFEPPPGVFVPECGESLARIVADNSGNVYVIGSTCSSDFPLVNPFQFHGSVVVAEIDPGRTGKGSLLYSTYFGGSGKPGRDSCSDFGSAIALDSSSHILVTGSTCSSDFPISTIKPPFQSKNHSPFYLNAYVSELDPSQAGAKQLLYSTYLGGNASDAGNAIGVDSSGKIYVAGSATSADFPVLNTCTRLQKLQGLGDDAFVTVLDPSMPPATQLAFSSFLGGSGFDVATAVARDAVGNLYVAGQTYSGDFPVTANAFQFGNNAFPAHWSNGFVTELDPGSTVCPTPFSSPKVTPTPTRTPTPVPTPSGPPHISKFPSIILVGGSFNIAGTNFTRGSVVNFFVATSGGPVKAGALAPRVHTPTFLTVDVPVTVPLGQGFASLQVINTDAGYTKSNVVSALLQGDPAHGIPTIKSINGKALAVTSGDPSFATNNVETVVMQGNAVTVGGTGFNTINGVAINLFCACPGGKVGPFSLKPGDKGLTSTLLSFTLPAKGMPNSPLTGPGSLVVINRGTFLASNAVSVPIGAQLKLTSLTLLGGGAINVKGAGFFPGTAINFFNTQAGGKVKNLGGLKADGTPLIPKTAFISENEFNFAAPPTAVSGPSYVQLLNPPYVPFSSTGNTPAGALTLP